jgi:hypothetical protein
LRRPPSWPAVAGHPQRSGCGEGGRTQPLVSPTECIATLGNGHACGHILAQVSHLACARSPLASQACFFVLCVVLCCVVFAFILFYFILFYFMFCLGRCCCSPAATVHREPSTRTSSPETTKLLRFPLPPPHPLQVRIKRTRSRTYRQLPHSRVLPYKTSQSQPQLTSVGSSCVKPVNGIRDLIMNYVGL